MMRARILLTAGAIAALTLSPAFAQSNVGVSQVQLDDSFANVAVSVDEADDVGAAAVAGGNSATTDAQNASMNVTAGQHSEGRARAQTDVVVWRAWGAAVANATATANGVVTNAENGDLDVSAAQSAMDDTQASTHLRTGNVWESAASATAAGNVQTASAVNGDLRLRTTQDNDGNVSANVETDACCVSTLAQSAALASANSIAATGYTTTLTAATRQASTGASVNARSDLYVGYSGDAIGGATANGNSFTADNQWGYVNVAASQANAANITAESYVTLGGDWLGLASASAYGVGNSATVSNLGSDTVIATDQTNTGAARAYGAVAGEGGDVIVSTAAYGNVVTGALCATCEGGALTASAYQSNAGPVESVATVRARRANSVGVSASAIGNAASYSVTGE
jgi:hypothetical protein